MPILFVSSLDMNKSSDPISIEKGKNIYTTGIGESEQKIMAVVSGNEIPASIMACANCHGHCGKGQTLQGIDIPDIRKKDHILRYGIDQPIERLDNYLNSKLKRAISMGLNHEGGNMHNMMPRYVMSLSDMDNLLAYLSVLGEDESCSEN